MQVYVLAKLALMFSGKVSIQIIKIRQTRYIHWLIYCRSIQPLVISLLDPQGVEALRHNREKLSHDLTELINEYGPKVFPDFDGNK